MRFHPFVMPKFLRRKAPQDALPEPYGTDLRDMGPTHICPCGSQVFNVAASFDEYELTWYFLDASCFSCGNLLRVPCPVDDPDRL